MKSKTIFKLFLSVLIFFQTLHLTAQPATGCFSIDYITYQVAYSVANTYDGGIIITGNAFYIGAGYENIFVTKLSSQFVVEWTKILGGTYYDEAFSIIQTADSGYAIAGNSELSFSNAYSNVYVVRLDSSGTILWSKTIGGIDTDAGSSIIQTSDGGFAIAGYSDSFTPHSAYLVKLDASGTLQWTSTAYGLNNLLSAATAIIQTIDNGYAIAGYSDNKMFVVKYSAAGTPQWNKTIEAGLAAVCNDFFQNSSGEFVLAGYVNLSGTSDVLVVKLDSTGNLIWSKTIGGAQNEIANEVLETNDKGIAISGSTNSFGGGLENAYLIKLDSLGNIMWTQTYGDSVKTAFYSMVKSENNGFILVGSINRLQGSGENTYIVKVDSLGNSCGCNSGSGGIVDTLGVLGTGAMFGAGGVETTFGTSSPLNIAITTICNSLSMPHHELHQEFSLYPNPSCQYTTFQVSFPMVNSTITLYNAMGQKVEQFQNINGQSYNISTANIPPGIYFLNMSQQNQNLVSTKLIIIN